jgi:acetylornithine deacetylase/succinyl-diaminopimelate desuccinylase
MDPSTFGSEVLSLTETLVRVESHSSPNFERGVADCLASYLRSHDIQAQVTEVGPGRVNVLAEVRGSAHGPTLLLTGHMDTVPAPEWLAPGGSFDPVKEGSLLYGRGTADMKGALAAMAVALVSAKASSLAGNVVFAGVAGEEGGGSVGTVELVRTGPRVDYAVVGEPTGLDVCVSHKGSHNMVVTVTGRSSHSATPEKGLNAVFALARAIQLVSSAVQPWLSSWEDGLLGRSTLTVTGAEGGGRTDTVPPQAKALYNLRYVPGIDTTEVMDRMKASLQPLDAEGFVVSVERRRVPRVSVAGTYELETVPLVTSPGDPLVEAARGAVLAAVGRQASVVGVPYWTDAAVIASKRQIPTIVFGPGDISCAHGPREFIEVDQLQQAAVVYRRLITQLCGG